MEEFIMTNTTITLRNFITKLKEAQTKEQIDWAWQDITEIVSKRHFQKEYSKKEKVLEFEDDTNATADFTSELNLDIEEKYIKHNNRNVKSSIIFRMKFKLKEFEIARHQAFSRYSKWIDDDLIDFWFMDAVLSVVNKRKINLTDFNDKQLKSYFIKSIIGEIQNRVIKEYEHRKNTKYYESDYKLDELNVIDQFIDEQPIQFQLFVERKGIKNILTQSQLEIYEYMQTGLTQQEVADALGVTQQNISKTNQKAINRLKEHKMEFDTFTKIARDQLDTYQAMEGFVNQLNDIRKYDTFSKFDYFAMTKDFVLKYLHEYSVFVSQQYNLIDVITDNLKVNEFDLYDAVINNQFVPKRDKERFVNCITRIFIKELARQKEVTGKVYHNIVEYYHDDYDLFLGLIKIS